MKEKKKNILDYTHKWLEVIKEKQVPTPEEANWIIEESLYNFREHFNAGWLEYRKSVTLSGDNAAVEWR